MSDDLLLAAILARRRQPMASGIALDPLHRLMRLGMYRRTDRASETADKYGTFLSFFLAFEPAVRTGRYGPKTCPMAASSGFPEAMDPLYQLVLVVLCRRMNSSVETGRTEVHSFVVDESRINLNATY